VPVLPRHIWMLLGVLGGLIGLQALVPQLATRSVTPPAPPSSSVAVDFVDTSPIELSRLNATSASGTTLVRNDSGQYADVQLETTLVDRSGNELGSASQQHVLIPYRATAVTITVSPTDRNFDLQRDSRLPAHGTVVLNAKAHKSADAPVTVKSRDVILLQVQPSNAELLITLAGVFGAILIILYGLAVSGRSLANPANGTPGWTPQSWGTNLAIGGALLAALLSIAALPAQTHYAARTSYAALSAFFAALVTLAPAVYGLLNVGGTRTPARALRLYALAAAITVWATIGQLGLSGLVFAELSIARVISQPAGYAAATLCAVIAVLVLAYAVRAVGSFVTPRPLANDDPMAPPAASRSWTLL
jgi:hypothetical protein